ncbi:DMT family transporter [Candidatus Bipolaricaulota bacterium]|nr:DMT family transporter [Candidatus Bipolaricaulota bacterium]
MAYLLLAGICFGSIGLFVNLIGNDISTLLIVSIRLLVTAGIIYTYHAIKGTRSEIPLESRRDYYIALAGGIIGFALTFSLYLKSLILIPVSEAVFLHYVAFPFSTIVYSTIYLGERFTKYELIPLAGTIAGVFFIYNVGFTGGFSSIFGYTIAFVSGITYSAALLVLKDLGKKKTTLQALFWPTVLGGTVLLPISLLTGFSLDLSGGTLGPLLGLIFISTLLGYSLFAKGLKETRAGLSSIILIIIEPLSAVTLAIVFLGERVSISSGLGGGLIVLSGLMLYLGNQSRTKADEGAGEITS